MPARAAQPLTTENILLGLIAGRSMHGYDLYRELHANRGLAMVWNIKQGMVYALVDKLAGQGYLEERLLPGEARPPRKEFSITPAGRAAFEVWRSGPVEHPRDLRQDFLARLYFARLAGFQPALELLQCQKDMCAAWLAGLQAQWDQAHPEAFERWVFAFRFRGVQGMLVWVEGGAREMRV